MFASILQDKNVDSIILLNTSLNKLDPNLRYAVHKTFEYAAYVVTRDRKKDAYTYRLLVPELERGRATEAIASIMQETNIKIELQTITTRNLQELFTALKIRGRIGVNFEYLSLAEHAQLKSCGTCIDISTELRELRRVKQEKERALIKEAARITDDIFSELIQELRKKDTTLRTERAIQIFLNQQFIKRNVQPSFKPIVASGANAANPHHDVRDVLNAGFCVIDFGVVYRGYCSDMTRTVYFGKPTPNEEKIYALLRSVQEASIAAAKPGMKCSALYAFAAKKLGTYGTYFIHGLGHGVGVEIHEAPSMNAKSKEKLRAGEIITIEPGIYVPEKYGMRIEDDILINTSGKNSILTTSTKELLILPFAKM